MKTEELMIRDKQSGHRMSGWGREEVIRGGSWGQGQLGGSAVVPSLLSAVVPPPSPFQPEMWRHFNGKFFHWGEI